MNMIALQLNGYVITFRQVFDKLNDILSNTRDSRLQDYSWEVNDTSKFVVTLGNTSKSSAITIPLPILIANQNNLEQFVISMIV